MVLSKDHRQKQQISQLAAPFFERAKAHSQNSHAWLHRYHTRPILKAFPAAITVTLQSKSIQIEVFGTTRAGYSANQTCCHPCDEQTVRHGNGGCREIIRTFYRRRYLLANRSSKLVQLYRLDLSIVIHAANIEHACQISIMKAPTI
jgi:hypothetical protein